jgi:hypothetical protein
MFMLCKGVSEFIFEDIFAEFVPRTSISSANSIFTSTPGGAVVGVDFCVKQTTAGASK